MNDEIRDDVMNNAEETKTQEHQEAVKQAVNEYIREREAKLKAEQKAELMEQERHKTRFTGQPFALTVWQRWTKRAAVALRAPIRLCRWSGS